MDQEGKVISKGEKVINTGKMPWRVANTEVTISLANKGLDQAIQLDANGYQLHKIASKSAGGTITVKLPSDCLYAVLRRGK